MGDFAREIVPPLIEQAWNRANPHPECPAEIVAADAAWRSENEDDEPPPEADQGGTDEEEQTSAPNPTTSETIADKLLGTVAEQLLLTMLKLGCWTSEKALSQDKISGCAEKGGTRVSKSCAWKKLRSDNLIVTEGKGCRAATRLTRLGHDVAMLLDNKRQRGASAAS